MAPSPDVPAPRLPLLDAATADAAVWALDGSHAYEMLATRDRAVSTAIASGHSREQVATALGIRTRDVDYILERAGHATR